MRDDGAGDADALFLTAGKLARIVIGSIQQAHRLQGDFGAFLPLGARHGQQEQWQLDVFVRGENGNQVVRLKDVADVGRAPLGEFGPGEFGDFGTCDGYGALIGSVDAGDEIQQRRFSGAAGAHQGDEFAVVDIQRNLVEGRNRFAALVITLDDVAQFNE